MRDKSAASGDGNLRMKYDFRATRSVVAVNEVNSNTCKAKQLDQTLIFN